MPQFSTSASPSHSSKGVSGGSLIAPQTPGSAAQGSERIIANQDDLEQASNRYVECGFNACTSPESQDYQSLLAATQQGSSIACDDQEPTPTRPLQPGIYTFDSIVSPSVEAVRSTEAHNQSGSLNVTCNPDRTRRFRLKLQGEHSSDFGTMSRVSHSSIYVSLYLVSAGVCIPG